MDEVARQGRTVLFVSHGMTVVKTLCERGVLLSQGQLLFDGNITETIRTYISESLESFVLSKSFNINKNKITLKKVSISKTEIISGDGFELEFSFEKKDDLDYKCDIAFHLVDEFGHLVFVGGTGKGNTHISVSNGLIKATCKIPKNLMNEGTYTIHRLLFVRNMGSVVFEIRNCFSFRIIAKEKDFGWMGEREEGIVDPKLAWDIQIN